MCVVCEYGSMILLVSPKRPLEPNESETLSIELKVHTHTHTHFMNLTLFGAANDGMDLLWKHTYNIIGYDLSLKPMAMRFIFFIIGHIIHNSHIAMCVLSRPQTDNSGWRARARAYTYYYKTQLYGCYILVILW